MKRFIHNVTYMDVESRQETKVDVLVEDGVVEAMAAGLACPADAEVLEADGLYMTAGWIDSHVHLYSGEGAGGVSGNDMIPNGVTFIQEAGSAGCGNFEDYMERDINPSEMRTKSYIYLSPMGISKTFPELQDLSLIDFDASEAMAKKYSKDIMGVKLRIDPRVCNDILGALKMAKELGNKLGLPIIVHASRSSESMEDILSYMSKDDIFAHIFANKTPGVLDAEGKVKQCVWDAQKRGVKFDLAHGNGNFSYDVCRKAVQQGFLPDSISTDLHKGSLPKVKSLALTMSKALVCGMDKWQVLSKVLGESAAMLRLTEEDKLTTVKVGKPADLVVFGMVDSTEALPDADGVTEVCPVVFKPVLTILGNKEYVPAE